MKIASLIILRLAFYTAVKDGDKQVISDAVRIGNYQKGELPERAEEFASRLLHTVYMGTDNRSERHTFPMIWSVGERICTPGELGTYVWFCFCVSNIFSNCLFNKYYTIYPI